MMQRLLQLEYLALWLGMAAIFSFSGYAWYWFWVWLLLPDIGMLGYLISPKIGAYTYNLTHHLAVGVGLALLGWVAIAPWMTAAGIIMLGHGFMDRLFGYGLKYTDSFQHTHLGMIGKKK